MNQNEWEICIKKCMENHGWTCDRDDETTLGFSFIEKDHHWIRDYDKKERRFVHYDGNLRINIMCKSEN